MSTISVIIPAPAYSQDLPVISSLKNVDYPEDKIEIIISAGKWPSIQRNRAAKAAKGDILYFFNIDSQVEPDIFKRAVSIINSDGRIAGVGGPDLTPQDNNYLQHLFGYAMSSYFAHWKMRARYSQIGRERVSGEKELLLSSLAIRKDVYLKANGFNEDLYPNEENELINRISSMGYRFIYDPGIKIYRDRRKSLSGLARQFYRYGRGRMKQVFIEGISNNLQFFLPVLFLLYLFLLPFTARYFISLLPLCAYILFSMMDSIYTSIKNKRNAALALFFIYPIMHISYAIGMISAAMERMMRRVE